MLVLLHLVKKSLRNEISVFDAAEKFLSKLTIYYLHVRLQKMSKVLSTETISRVLSETESGISHPSPDNSYTGSTVLRGSINIQIFFVVFGLLPQEYAGRHIESAFLGVGLYSQQPIDPS